VAAKSSPFGAIAPAGGLDERKNTALHRASKGGEVEAVRRELAGGADVNACNKTGITPLIYAASEGRLEAVELLLQVGLRSRSALQAAQEKMGKAPAAEQPAFARIIQLLSSETADNTAPSPGVGSLFGTSAPPSSVRAGETLATSGLDEAESPTELRLKWYAVHRPASNAASQPRDAFSFGTAFGELGGSMGGQKATSPFGAPAPASPFGSAPAISAHRPSAFGGGLTSSPMNAGANAFGAPAATAFGGSPFGAPAVAPAPSAPVFGAPAPYAYPPASACLTPAAPALLYPQWMVMNLNRVLKATAASVGELPSLEQAALIAATSPALQVGSAEATLPRSARPPPSVEELHSASPPLWAEAAHLEIARSRVHPALRSGMLPAGGGSVRWRREVAAGSSELLMVSAMLTKMRLLEDLC
ncbi:MAG: hypothetical protein SGPRY_007882, partial [Prymnesium sp.]